MPGLVEKARLCAVLAERALMRLLPSLGRDRAQQLVAAALERSRDSDRSFAVCLGEVPDAAAALAVDELRDLDRPEQYLGEAERLRRELLAGSEDPDEETARFS